MTTFNASVPLWDLGGTYPQVSDDDFLALLQKDLANSLSAADTSLLSNPSPLSTIPPSQLSSFQAPVTGPSTPPLTDDSSPSPSSSSIPEPQSATEPSNSSTRNRRQSTTASRRTSLAIPAAVAAATHDSPDSLKRKASTADLNPSTGRKASLSESNASPKTPASGPARTKPPKDETRLMRRKEQNRAAQRAFRERKERHVHELEERLAELEAASQAKDEENENLRDLLGRLQEENQTLKAGSSSTQAPSSSSFSFSMPPPSSIPSQSQQQQSQQQQTQAPPLLHHTSSSSSSGIGSPWVATTGVQTPQLVANSPPLDTASLTGMSNMNFTMMDGDTNSSSDIDWSSLTTLDPNALNMLDADINMMDFSSDSMDNNLFGSPSSSDANGGNGNGGMTGGFRTIASNPMFMSFAEPFSAWDAMSQSNVAGQNQGQSMGATAGSALSRGSSGSSNWDMNMFNSFGSWSGPPSNSQWPQQQNQQQQQHQHQQQQQQQSQNQWNHQSPPHSQPPSHQNSLDELLNIAAMSTNNSTATSPGQQHGGMRSILGLGEPVSSPNNGPTSSPSQQAIDGSATNAASGGMCPRTKADFAAKIANDMASPFGPQSSMLAANGMSRGASETSKLMNIVSPFNSSSSSSASSAGSPGLGGAVSPREPGGGTSSLTKEGNGSVSCTGSVFATTEKSEANIEVLAAWRKITSDPQFKNVDINELCAEFTNKAKCDGTKVVLDPAGVNSILQKFAGRVQ